MNLQANLSPEIKRKFHQWQNLSYGFNATGGLMGNTHAYQGLNYNNSPLNFAPIGPAGYLPPVSTGSVNLNLVDSQKKKRPQSFGEPKHVTSPNKQVLSQKIMKNKLTPGILVSTFTCSAMIVLPSFAQNYDVGSFNYQGQSGGQGNITNTNLNPYRNLPVNQNSPNYIRNAPGTIPYTVTPNPSAYPNVPAQYLQPSPLTNPVNVLGGPVAPLVPKLPGVPTGVNGLPPTTLMSFVKEAGGHAEAIYGDEGTIRGPR